MRTNPERAVLSAAIAMTLVHAVLWVPILLYLILFVPRLKKIFADFGMVLPRMSEWMIASSDFVATYWYLLPVLIVFVLLADGAVIYLLRRGTGRSGPSWIWFSLIILLTILVMIGMVTASLLPMITLLEALSR